MLSFITYRVCCIYNYESLFLLTDSWHKLSNIFLLIQCAQLIVYLGRLSDQAGSYFVAFSVGLTIVLQEKDSHAYKYSLVTFVVHYTVLFCAAQGTDKPKYINSYMV